MLWSHRYIQADSRNTEKKIRTENGTLIKASFKSGAYTDWQTKNKVEKSVLVIIGVTILVH